MLDDVGDPELVGAIAAEFALEGIGRCVACHVRRTGSRADERRDRAVSSGALKLGQWPVAGNTVIEQSDMACCTYADARRHAGYVLDIAPGLVDLHRFRRLVEQCSDPQRSDDAQATALAEALGLWRGPPWPASRAHGPRRSGTAAIGDGWTWRCTGPRSSFNSAIPAAVITTVPDLAAEYPPVEALETLLMRALHAAGWGADALDRAL